MDEIEVEPGSDHRSDLVAGWRALAHHVYRTSVFSTKGLAWTVECDCGTLRPSLMSKIQATDLGSRHTRTHENAYDRNRKLWVTSLDQVLTAVAELTGWTRFELSDLVRSAGPDHPGVWVIPLDIASIAQVAVGQGRANIETDPPGGRRIRFAVSVVD